MTKECRNCEYSYRRSSHDFATYGNRGFPYECLKTKRTTYKKPTDSCEQWEEVNEKIRGNFK